MAKFAPKVPLWAVMLLCCVMVAALAPFIITKRHESAKALICDQCGIRSFVVSEKLVESLNPIREQSSFEETDLSLWFRAHISTNTWRLNGSSGETYWRLAGLRLWKISSSSGSWTTPSLIYFSADERAQLEGLLRRSPDACRNFIHAKLQGKEGPDE
jgi:hypothetical protein